VKTVTNDPVYKVSTLTRPETLSNPNRNEKDLIQWDIIDPFPVYDEVLNKLHAMSQGHQTTNEERRELVMLKKKHKSFVNAIETWNALKRKDEQKRQEELKRRMAEAKKRKREDDDDGEGPSGGRGGPSPPAGKGRKGGKGGKGREEDAKAAEDVNANLKGGKGKGGRGKGGKGVYN